MTKIKVDVVIDSIEMTLQDLSTLSSGQVKNLDSFIQSEVSLKTGDSIVATGTLIKVHDNFGVMIDKVFTSSANVTDGEFDD